MQSRIVSMTVILIAASLITTGGSAGDLPKLSSFPDSIIGDLHAKTRYFETFIGNAAAGDRVHGFAFGHPIEQRLSMTARRTPFNFMTGTKPADYRKNLPAMPSSNYPVPGSPFAREAVSDGL